MRKGTLVAAKAVLAVACSACSGSSRPPVLRFGSPAQPASVPAQRLGLCVLVARRRARHPGAGATGSGASWTVYHGDAEATGVQAAQARLLPSRRAWGSPVLDGQLYGEPLVADGYIVAPPGAFFGLAPWRAPCHPVT